MKKSLALIMSLIMIFSTFSLCTVSASAATAAPAAVVSTQEVDLESDFALIFKGMFREILNSFMKRFGFKSGFYVTDIDITQTKANVNVNEKIQLKVTLEPDKLKNNTITWHAEDSSVVTVSANGVVTGRKTGLTKVYAIADGGFYDSCIVSVSKDSSTMVPCVSVSCGYDNETIELYKNDFLYEKHIGKLRFAPVNTTDIPVATSSNNSVATVKINNGEVYVTAIKEGKATINIVCGKAKTKFNVIVNPTDGLYEYDKQNDILYIYDSNVSDTVDFYKKGITAETYIIRENVTNVNLAFSKDIVWKTKTLFVPKTTKSITISGAYITGDIVNSAEIERICYGGTKEEWENVVINLPISKNVVVEYDSRMLGVTVPVYSDRYSKAEYIPLEFNVGETVTSNMIIEKLKDQHGITVVMDDIQSTYEIRRFSNEATANAFKIDENNTCQSINLSKNVIYFTEGDIGKPVDQYVTFSISPTENNEIVRVYSTNPNVAEVILSYKNNDISIFPQEVGETTVTVCCGNQKETFKVVVTPSEI